jgi:hypothetical protein
MGKIIRLTESQLKDVIKKIISEQPLKLGQHNPQFKGPGPGTDKVGTFLKNQGLKEVVKIDPSTVSLMTRKTNAVLTPQSKLYYNGYQLIWVTNVKAKDNKIYNAKHNRVPKGSYWGLFTTDAIMKWTKPQLIAAGNERMQG